MEKKDVDTQVLVRVLARKPGWKEANFQVSFNILRYILLSYISVVIIRTSYLIGVTFLVFIMIRATLFSCDMSLNHAESVGSCN